MLQRIEYSELNSRQKENYNYQKVASELANYGFNCMWLNDDWQGADFIACHIDGSTFIKVQLKGRLTLDKKYNDKEIHIAFCHNESWYLYLHDQLQNELISLGLMKGTKSWEESGAYSWPSLSKSLFNHMQQYVI